MIRAEVDVMIRVSFVMTKLLYSDRGFGYNKVKVNYAKNDKDEGRVNIQKMMIRACAL